MAEPSTARLDADVVVIGLGGVGSAAACFAARRGLRVLGLERFALGGHLHGASHDHSRIIRRSYHTEHYVRLTAGAYDAWREVERASGEQCIWTTGGIDLFPAGAAIDIATYTDSMAAAGVPFTLLDGSEVRRRWPAITVADDVVAAAPGRHRARLAGPGRAAAATPGHVGGRGPARRGGRTGAHRR